MGPITVVGGGNGAHATAADLALRDHDVRMLESPRFSESIAQTREQGGIHVHGALSGFARLALVTTDAHEAIEGASLILIVAPAFAHDALTTEMAPHLRAGQTVVFNPGAMGSSIRFSRAVAEMRPDLKVSDLDIGETASLTHGARLTEAGTVDILVITRNILFSTFPAERAQHPFEMLRSLFPGLISGRNVFDTGLNNGNPISHPIATVLNAGQVERFRDDFYLYRDGMTPSVVGVMEAVDRERIRLCEQLDLTVIPVHERIVNWGYARPEATLQLSYSTSPVYTKLRGPGSLRLRYLSEDVPYGLVPWASLAGQLGVETAAMDAVVTLAGLLNSTDYRATGVTMRTMALDGFSRDDLMDYLSTGAGVS